MRQINRLVNVPGLLSILLTINSLTVLSQPAPGVSAVVQSFDQHRRQSLVEKLFLHTDQSFYLAGETLWFKAYYVDGTRHQPLDVSKVAYVELLDSEHRPVLQTKMALTADGGQGSLFLPASLDAGNYLMRAYTSWMKNFSADYFFEKSITIVNSFKPLNLPLLAEIPAYDLAFFPEGGQLVQGLPGRMAFKITDAAGRGVPVRGWLLNAQNDTLSRIQSHKFGIGTFDVTPEEGATYRVVLTDPQGRTLTRPLPASQARGYVMRLEEAPNEQLKITVNSNATAGGSVYLFAHTRNEIKLTEQKPIEREATFVINKAALGDGITHLTVFNADQQPVCERLYAKRPTASLLTIDPKTDQAQYTPRTTVKVALTATAANQPAAIPGQTSVSMAVYRLDSLAIVDSGTILSYLWLTSDLRGAIESPDYYLQADNAEVVRARDNLMLTHGWRRFRWADVLPSKTGAAGAGQLPKPFLAEHNGLLINGIVTDPATGAPVPNVQTYLSAPGKPIRLYASRSTATGQIRFEMTDFYGPRNLIVQTCPEDSLYKLTINNPFSELPPATRLAPFSVGESLANQLLDRSVAMQVQSTFGQAGAAVRYRYPPVDSTAFYGKPSETYLLDSYTRFPRMEEVLREYVPGVLPRKRQGRFRLFVPNTPYRALFDQPSMVLIDGVPVFDMDKVIEFSPLKIKQLDVITNRYLLGEAAFSGLISFITYKGDLATFPLDNRLLKLDYEGLQGQREFYTPRHTTAANQQRLPDARTLLYWNPALKTDAQGKVLVEFPTSDQIGTFVVEVNGLAPNGAAGSGRAFFEVNNTAK